MSDTQGGARSSVETVDRTTQGTEQVGVGTVQGVEQIDRTPMGADPDGGGAAEGPHPAHGLQR